MRTAVSQSRIAICVVCPQSDTGGSIIRVSRGSGPSCGIFPLLAESLQITSMGANVSQVRARCAGSTVRD